MKAEGGRLLLSMRFMNKEILRFLVSGLINTGATYLLYIMLLLLVDYTLAYTFAYVIGIALSYVLYSTFVFKQKMSLKTLIRYPLVYGLQYLLNLILLYLLVEVLDIHASWAMIGSLCITVPVTYITTKIILSYKRKDGER